MSVPLVRRARMGRLALRSGAACVLLLTTMAHVGNPDTIVDGAAGPYKVRVIVRAPDVIPQRAEVFVRVPGGSDVRRVAASARFWDAGAQGAPPPDEAQRVAGDSTLWTVQLWLMRQGSYAISVDVEGSLGSGTLLVPLTATALVVKPMSVGLRLLLAALVSILAASLISIVGASVKEGKLPGGEHANDSTRAAAVRARVLTTGVILATLVAIGFWWRDVDRQHRAFLYRPTPMTVSTPAAAGMTVLRVSFRSAEPKRRTKQVARSDEGLDDGPADRTTPLIPDHGKLMHLFVVRSDRTFLAHLHPLRTDSGTFEAALPPLAKGSYLLFADVLQQSGFAQTLVARDTLVSETTRWTPTDSDDAMHEASEATALPHRATLETNTDTATFVVGREATLVFTLRDSVGHVADVEPYLGMAGHAVIVRAGGDVFVHVHPSGTASMGAQQALAMAMSAPAGAMDMAHGPLPASLVFPFVFPKPGAYTIWVQFRYVGEIRTIPFTVTVRERTT